MCVSGTAVPRGNHPMRAIFPVSTVALYQVWLTSGSLRFDANRRIVYRTHQERADAPPTCLPGQGGTRKGMWPTRQINGPNHVCVCLALLRVHFTQETRP